VNVSIAYKITLQCHRIKSPPIQLEQPIPTLFMMANETENLQSDLSEHPVASELKLKELELQVEKQRQNFGESHVDTQEIEHELSLEYQFAEKWEKAEELQQRIIKIKKRELGETHPDALRSMLGW
jgi:hypothetical protein